MKSCDKKWQSGFTLIEVLVALVVMSVSLSAALYSANLHIHNAAFLRDNTFAHWVALNKVTELQLQLKWVALGDAAGAEELGGHQWLWKTKTSKTSDPDLRRVDIRVVRQLTDESASARLVAFIGRP